MDMRNDGEQTENRVGVRKAERVGSLSKLRPVNSSMYTAGTYDLTNPNESGDTAESTVEDAGMAESPSGLPSGVHFTKMPKKKVRQHQPVRPPMAVIVGVAGSGKSMLGSCILGRREYRAEFKVGTKTTAPGIVLGKGIAVMDTPGLPDPYPSSSDAYYDATVRLLREAGYVNALIFLVNHDRITPTLIRNYGILYRAFNKLSCVKIFVLRRDSSFLSMSMADQDRIVEDGQDTVNGIMRASRLKRWRARQFFILTNGAGDEQERQVNKIREQVRISPVTMVSDKEGLKTTTESARLSTGADEEGKRNSGRDFEECLAEPPKWPGIMTGSALTESQERDARQAKQAKLRKQEQQRAEKAKKAHDKKARKAQGEQQKNSGGSKKEEGKSGCTVM